VEVQGDVLAQQRVSNSGENKILATQWFQCQRESGKRKAQQEGPEELDRALEQIDAEEADYWSRLLDRACRLRGTIWLGGIICNCGLKKAGYKVIEPRRKQNRTKLKLRSK